MPAVRQLRAFAVLRAGQFMRDRKSDRPEEPGYLDFDEDFGVDEVTGIGNDVGVNMKSLFWDVVGQEGCDQVPEIGLVSLLPCCRASQEANPSASRSTSAGAEADSSPKYTRGVHPR